MGGDLRRKGEGVRTFLPARQSLCDWLGTMKRMKKAVLNKAEGRAAHKFQFELTPTAVGALDRVLKGLDGSSLFVQERPSESNASCHTASTARGCGARDLRLQPLWQPPAQGSSLRHLRLWRSPRRRPVAAVMTVAAVVPAVAPLPSVGAHLATGDPRAQGRGIGAHHGRRQRGVVGRRRRRRRRRQRRRRRGRQAAELGVHAVQLEEGGGSLLTPSP